MNKLCITKKGIEVLNEENQELELESRFLSTFRDNRRNPSLPQLITTASII